MVETPPEPRHREIRGSTVEGEDFQKRLTFHTDEDTVELITLGQRGLYKHLRVSLKAHFIVNSVFLIDGGFICHKIKQAGRQIKPSDITQFVTRARELYDEGYRLLRVYYYDCPPSAVKTKLPVSKNPVDFGATAQFKFQSQFFADLKRAGGADFTAVREGRLVFRGWNLKDDHQSSNPTLLTDAHYVPDFEQKGVDIKIGLDIAWISLEKIAQRIYLVTGDSDFIPAMKFARRSGVQVFYFTLGHGVTDELKDHADVLIEEPITRFLV